jgi:hypothetical protein
MDLLLAQDFQAESQVIAHDEIFRVIESLINIIAFII